MSMFSLPDDLEIDAKAMETMLKTWSDTMNTGAIAAPVFGAPAAAAALGAGVVAQAWGTWLGAVHGMAAATHHLHTLDTALIPASWFWNSEDGDEQAFALSSPFGFFAGAARTAIADIERTARDVVEFSEHVAEDLADEAEKATAEMENIAGNSNLIAAEIAEKALGASAVVDATEAPLAPSDDMGTGETALDLLPEDFVAPKRIDKPAAPDDLTMIAGVGPKLAATLNELGVWTFAQIAAWTPAEIAWVDDTLSFKGRIGRDGWIEQAAALERGGREEYVKVFGKEPR